MNILAITMSVMDDIVTINGVEYRRVEKPALPDWAHKLAEARERGETLQYRLSQQHCWVDEEGRLSFDGPRDSYRIKPQPRKQVMQTVTIRSDKLEVRREMHATPQKGEYITYTCDDTYRLSYLEVIKVTYLMSRSCTDVEVIVLCRDI